MAERRLQKNPAAEAIPGTPRIRDVRIVSGSEVTGLCSRGSSRVPFKLKDNYVSSVFLLTLVVQCMFKYHMFHVQIHCLPKNLEAINNLVRF